MNEIISDLHYLIGDDEVEFDDIFNQLQPHYPSLTKEELYGIVVQANLLCPQVNNGPLKLKRKKIVPLPPDQHF